MTEPEIQEVLRTTNGESSLPDAEQSVFVLEASPIRVLADNLRLQGAGVHEGVVGDAAHSNSLDESTQNLETPQAPQLKAKAKASNSK